MKNGGLPDASDFGCASVRLFNSFYLNYYMFDNMNVYQVQAQWKRDRIEREKKVVPQVRGV